MEVGHVTKELTPVKEQDGIDTQPPLAKREEVVDRFKQLETKIAFYESEHQTFQNQLLNQRKGYEEKFRTMEELLEDKDTEDFARKQVDMVYDNAQIVHLKIQVVQLSEINDQLLKANDKLKLQIAQFEIPAQLASSNVKDEKAEAILNERLMEVFHQMGNQMTLETDLQNQRQHESDKLLKLQKKMDELERYLEEKDHTLLEQENQLSDLQDSINQYHRAEEKLNGQLRDKMGRNEELIAQIKTVKDQHEMKISDMFNQIKGRDKSLQEAWQTASDKESDIQKLMKQLDEAEEAISELRSKSDIMEEERFSMSTRLQAFEEEFEQMKSDFQQILNFKNDLETLVEDQTAHIEQKNKKLHVLEDTVRFQESEIEKKDGILRRITIGADETRKKLTQAEMKLRQITQTTLKDLKLGLKDKGQEIEVLKEMVRSANKHSKAKEIDVQRLTKKIQRLEKLIESNKGLIGGGGGNSDSRKNYQRASQEEEYVEEGVSNGYATPPIKNNDIFGLNPINYNIEDEVQMEILQAQNQRQFHPQTIPKGQDPSIKYRHAQQSNEQEEAAELDRMLEEERRNMSQDVFQKKYDEKFDKYYNGINQPNVKNNSTSIRGIFGGHQDVGDVKSAYQGHDTSMYEGMLPNLNLSRKEKLENELMTEVNESVRKDKYMTPNIQARTKNIHHKLNGAAYGGGQGNQPYYHERNNGKGGSNSRKAL